MRRRTGLLTAIAGVAVLGVAGLRGTLRRYVIAEHSMAPALNDGDWVLAQRSTATPGRGDIVVFDSPVRPGFSLVKRVIGRPGEVVTIRNGQVHVDGRVLAEPWADGPTRPDGEWKLEDHEVYVLSDARSSTIADSRAFGPIHVLTTQWRVRFRYWPIGSIGRL